MLETKIGRRTPFVPQAEAAECSLACLAMVAGHHGLRTDLATLRQRFSLSLKGTTLVQVMQMAEELGFNVRPLRLDLEELDQLPLPAILHWDLNHFVVLTRVSGSFGRRRYHINDPASAPVTLSESDATMHFTGIALEMLKSESFRPKIDMRKLRISHLWSSISGFWQTLALVVVLSLLLQGTALVAPLYLQVAIDTVLPAADLDLLTILALGFAGLALLAFIAGWARALMLATLNNTLSYQIIVNLFRHLSRLPLQWFEKRHVGDIIARFGSTKPITDLLSQGMLAALLDGVMAIATLALMFVFAPNLAWLSIAALATYLGLKLAFLQTLRFLNLNVITANAVESSVFIETIRGISAIKSFGQEGNRQRLWQRTKADAVNAQIKLSRITAGFDASAQFILAIERVIFIFIAVKMALAGSITAGMIFAFQAYKQQFLDASLRLVEQGINFSILQMHLGRIADIALTKDEPVAKRQMQMDLDATRLPSIELREIRFTYGFGEPEILKGVNLTISPGEKVVMVGPSGGGKTTLLKIMLGLLQPTYGEVLINGIPLNSYGLAQWRAQIGALAQNDFLFAGSIAENISFFDPAPDAMRVREVAQLCSLDQEIEAMPMQYDTLVGDMGGSLSGGQRQRLLLARAIYRAPTALFTDEATSNLDPHSEAKVIDALAKLEATHVSVAHRGKAMAAAARVLFVEGGKVKDLNALTGNLGASNIVARG